MKVLHINKHSSGGAFNAAFRQHLALLADGVDSYFLTLGEVDGAIPNHITYKKKKNGYIRRLINNLGPFKTRKNLHLDLLSKLDVRAKEIFTFPDSDIDLVPLINEVNPDVINLHWVADFLNVDNFFQQVDQPIVWTLHDMNPFLGGFHYDEIESQEAAAFEELEKRNLEIKRSHYPERLHVVTPSKWLKECSHKSALMGRYPHTLIPYSLPVETYTYLDKNEARKALDFPAGKILLFVAEKVGVKRKGVDLLLEAFNLLRNHELRHEFKMVAIGNKSEDLNAYSFIHQHGYVHGPEEMAKFYSAADGFLMPSRMDNLPNVMLESLGCGTPIVAFNIGGIPDVVCNGENGVLVPEVSAEALAEGILKFFQNDYDRPLISAKTRKLFHPKVQSKAYVDLYQSILLS